MEPNQDEIRNDDASMRSPRNEAMPDRPADYVSPDITPGVKQQPISEQDPKQPNLKADIKQKADLNWFQNGLMQAGKLVVHTNQTDLAPNPGKALGQSMLLGVGSCILSLMMGGGLLPSLMVGAGGLFFGQEIMKAGSNMWDVMRGEKSLGSTESLTSFLPLLASGAGAMGLGMTVPHALATMLVGTGVGSRLGNAYFSDQHPATRYYGVEVKQPDKAAQQNQTASQQSQVDLTQKMQERPELIKGELDTMRTCFPEQHMGKVQIPLRPEETVTNDLQREVEKHASLGIKR